MLALAMKILIPPGFMPGTSLAQPLVLCPGQAPMPMTSGMAMASMGHGSHHDSDGHSHDGNDHPCTFAGLGATALAADLHGPLLSPVPAVRAPALAALYAVASGRGMAAPPPPSHAPPRNRA